MVVWFSKSDFWIPEQICDFRIFFPDKKYFFSRPKYFSEDLEKIFFQIFFENQKISLKSQYEKFENFDFFAIFFSRNFRFFNIDFSMKIFGFRKKSEQIFFRDLPKNILVSKKNIFYLEKIYENRKFAQESKNHT